jgi:hypothetical protein
MLITISLEISMKKLVRLTAQTLRGRERIVESVPGSDEVIKYALLAKLCQWRIHHKGTGRERGEGSVSRRWNFTLQEREGKSLSNENPIEESSEV